MTPPTPPRTPPTMAPVCDLLCGIFVGAVVLENEAEVDVDVDVDKALVLEAVDDIASIRRLSASLLSQVAPRKTTCPVQYL